MIGILVALIVVGGILTLAGLIATSLLIHDDKVLIGKHRRRIASAEADLKVKQHHARGALFDLEQAALVESQHQLALGQGDPEKVLDALREERKRERSY